MIQKIILPARIEQLTVVNQMLREVFKSAPKEQLHRIELVVEELLANVCNYAYGGGSGEASFSCGLVTFDGESCVRLQFEDHGAPFDPFVERPEVDVQSDLDERAGGGLGIYFVTTIAKHYVYARINDTNQVTIYIDNVSAQS
ncbi:MAG: ATP-binding protein [Succinivibrio sp.]|nr:ATP-binding protein [Succinivibrio sp.]